MLMFFDYVWFGNKLIMFVKKKYIFWINYCKFVILKIYVLVIEIVCVKLIIDEVLYLIIIVFLYWNFLFYKI